MKPGKVSDATSRLKVREQQRKRASVRRITSAVVVAALVGGLVYLVALSPVLAVQQISISGVSVLSEDQVIAAAAVPIGTPLAMIDAAKVADRVAALAPVAGVTVSRQWPTRLEIAITERQARLAIPTSGGGYQLADANGVVFEKVDTAPAGLVQVVAAADDQQLLTGVGEVFSALSPTTAAKVSRVEAPTQDSIELQLTDGRQVFWGSADQSELKSRVVDDLLAMPGKVYDVSAPAFPTRR